MKYFTAGLNIGETRKPSNPSYYRHTNFQWQFLQQCHGLLRPEDELFLIGNLAVSAQDLAFYDHLPPCKLRIFPGDAEAEISDFASTVHAKLSQHAADLEIITGDCYVMIAGAGWRIDYDSRKLNSFSCPMPSICGDGYGLWRVRQLLNGEPIVNVDVDAWGGQLVSEEYLYRQRENVMDGLYAHILDGAQFSDAHYREQQAALSAIDQSASALMQTEIMQAYIKRWGWNFVRAGILVANDQNEFLCVEEPRMLDKLTGEYKDVYDIWNLPSGSTKSPDEGSLAAAIRRTAEETGYPIEPLGYLFTQEKPDPKHPYVMPVYAAKVSGEPQDFDHRAIRSVRWMTRDRIEALNAEGKLRSPQFMLEAIRRYTAGEILPLETVKIHRRKNPPK